MTGMELLTAHSMESENLASFAPAAQIVEFEDTGIARFIDVHVEEECGGSLTDTHSSADTLSPMSELDFTTVHVHESLTPAASTRDSNDSELTPLMEEDKDCKLECLENNDQFQGATCNSHKSYYTGRETDMFRRVEKSSLNSKIKVSEFKFPPCENSFMYSRECYKRARKCPTNHVLVADRQKDLVTYKKVAKEAQHSCSKMAGHEHKETSNFQNAENRAKLKQKENRKYSLDSDIGLKVDTTIKRIDTNANILRVTPRSKTSETVQTVNCQQNVSHDIKIESYFKHFLNGKSVSVDLKDVMQLRGSPGRFKTHGVETTRVANEQHTLNGKSVSIDLVDIMQLKGKDGRIKTYGTKTTPAADQQHTSYQEMDDYKALLSGKSVAVELVDIMKAKRTKDTPKSYETSSTTVNLSLEKKVIQERMERVLGNKKLKVRLKDVMKGETASDDTYVANSEESAIEGTDGGSSNIEQGNEGVINEQLKDNGSLAIPKLPRGIEDKFVDVKQRNSPKQPRHTAHTCYCEVADIPNRSSMLRKWIHSFKAKTKHTTVKRKSILKHTKRHNMVKATQETELCNLVPEIDKLSDFSDDVNMANGDITNHANSDPCNTASQNDYMRNLGLTETAPNSERPHMGNKIHPNRSTRKRKKSAKVLAMEQQEKMANYRRLMLRLLKEQRRKSSDSRLYKTKKKRETAYTLWCNANRKRVVHENPGIDFSTVSKILGEMWSGLSDKDKMKWKRKAKKAGRKVSTLIQTGKTASLAAAKQQTLAQPIPIRRGGQNSNSRKVTGAMRAAILTKASKQVMEAAPVKTNMQHDDIYELNETKLAEQRRLRIKKGIKQGMVQQFYLQKGYFGKGDKPVPVLLFKSTLIDGSNRDNDIVSDNSQATINGVPIDTSSTPVVYVDKSAAIQNTETIYMPTANAVNVADELGVTCFNEDGETVTNVKEETDRVLNSNDDMSFVITVNEDNEENINTSLDEIKNEAARAGMDVFDSPNDSLLQKQTGTINFQLGNESVYAVENEREEQIGDIEFTSFRNEGFVQDFCVKSEPLTPTGQEFRVDDFIVNNDQSFIFNENTSNTLSEPFVKGYSLYETETQNNICQNVYIKPEAGNDVCNDNGTNFVENQTENFRVGKYSIMNGPNRVGSEIIKAEDNESSRYTSRDTVYRTSDEDCYCRCSSVDLTNCFSCEICKRNFHPECLKTGGPPSVLKGDILFRFTCRKCANGEEEFERIRLSWMQVVQLTLYNLHLGGTGKCGYFRWKEDICRFIDRHWKTYFGSHRKKTSLWHSSVASKLSLGTPSIFTSGYQELREFGWWRLAEMKPPVISKQGIPTKRPLLKRKEKPIRQSDPPKEGLRSRSGKTSIQAAIELKAKRSILTEAKDMRKSKSKKNAASATPCPIVVMETDQTPSLFSADLTSLTKMPMNSPQQDIAPPDYVSTPLTAGNQEALVFTGLLNSERRTSCSSLSSDQSQQQQADIDSEGDIDVVTFDERCELATTSSTDSSGVQNRPKGKQAKSKTFTLSKLNDNKMFAYPTDEHDYCLNPAKDHDISTKDTVHSVTGAVETASNTKVPNMNSQTYIILNSMVKEATSAPSGLLVSTDNKVPVRRSDCDDDDNDDDDFTKRSFSWQRVINERSRRFRMKQDFFQLRDVNPALKGKACSKPQILLRSIEFISDLERENASLEATLDILRKKNRSLTKTLNTLVEETGWL